MKSLFLILAAAVLAAAPARAQQESQEPPGAAATPESLTLRPGDVVRVTIWREGDLSGEFFVDEQGRLTLPLLGEIDVSGVPVRRLREMLTERYRAELRNPSIVITPLRRINVLGEVRRPGLYTLDPTVSLAEVIALAGGATEEGNLNRIRLIRGGQVIRDRVSAAESVEGVALRSGDQVIVDRRSWFERNATFVASMLISVTGIIISIMNRPGTGGQGN